MGELYDRRTDEKKLKGPQFHCLTLDSGSFKCGCIVIGKIACVLSIRSLPSQALPHTFDGWFRSGSVTDVHWVCWPFFSN